MGFASTILEISISTPENKYHFGRDFFKYIDLLSPAWPLACTEMTRTKKIEILRAVHVVELSWAPIVIIFSLKNLHLGCRASP